MMVSKGGLRLVAWLLRVVAPRVQSPSPTLEGCRSHGPHLDQFAEVATTWVSNDRLSVHQQLGMRVAGDLDDAADNAILILALANGDLPPMNVAELGL